MVLNDVMLIAGSRLTAVVWRGLVMCWGAALVLNVDCRLGSYFKKQVAEQMLRVAVTFLYGISTWVLVRRVFCAKHEVWNTSTVDTG